MIFVIFLITVLLIYLGFIQYPLIKRKTRDVTLKNPNDKRQYHHNEESAFDPHERNYHQSFNPAMREDFFSEENLDFIFKEENTKIFLHYTSDRAIADKILVEGFKFVTSFYKTGKIIKNPDFDPSYYSMAFNENLGNFDD